MRIPRLGVIALMAALVVAGTTVALQTDVVAAPAAAQGIRKLDAYIDLPAGVWTDTPLQVTLPDAGTYTIDADVRGRLDGVPPFNTFITARLFDVTAGAPVPDSERLVDQVIDVNPGNARTGSNATAPIDQLISVGKRTVIRLQAIRVDATGTAQIAQIYSDGYGRTTLRFSRAVEPGR
ncbi:hypothetical protein [Actinokineospora enzanensis]|uniref:hypothetical protein n=1 Tax=Actinokineospora enzanensis TaxID=155975 RepID=UPI00037BC004|nr:hypothetical protein [Actinokineospora enzanensis]